MFTTTLERVRGDVTLWHRMRSTGDWHTDCTCMHSLRTIQTFCFHKAWAFQDLPYISEVRQPLNDQHRSRGLLNTGTHLLIQKVLVTCH